MTENQAWLAFSWIGLGSRSFKRLVAQSSDLSKLWPKRSSVIRKLRLGAKQRDAVCARARDFSMADAESRLKASGISYLCLYQKKYPELLKEIYDPPPVLYVRGNISILNQPSIAIVGSRQASMYGKKCTEHFSEYLAERNWVINSGLAYGIDSWAHQAALGTGSSIAVLAGGLSTKLMNWQAIISDEILAKDGLIISEMPPDVPALKHNFLLRNRIIAGLSYATLVVEARAKSGALTTARATVNAGRTVYAIPADIDRPSAAGSLALLRQGATMVQEPQEIHEEVMGQLTDNHREHIRTDMLGPIHKQILNKIGNAKLGFEQLVRSTKKPTERILVALSELEVTGRLARQQDGTFYIKS